MKKLSLLSKDRNTQLLIDKVNEIIDALGQSESEGKTSNRTLVAVEKKANGETGIKLNTNWGIYTSVSGTFELEK